MRAEEAVKSSAGPTEMAMAMVMEFSGDSRNLGLVQTRDLQWSHERMKEEKSLTLLHGNT